MAVFGATEEAKIFSAQGLTLSIGGGGDLLAINAQIQFGRNPTPVPTLGKGLHWSLSQPSGTVSAGTVLGIGNPQSAFHIDKMCSTFAMTVSANPGQCPSGSRFTSVCKGCIATSLTISAQGDQGYATGQFGASFSSMDLS